MTLYIRKLGEIQISKVQPMNSDEYQVLDIESLFKIEEIVGYKITEAYISEYEDDHYLVVYFDIPENLALLCDDTRVFDIAEIRG